MWNDFPPCFLFTGILTSANGNVYDGEFVEDMKDGYGRKNYIFNSSCKLYTTFISVLQCINGEKYEGSWKSNFAEGFGALTYADGDRYVVSYNIWLS